MWDIFGQNYKQNAVFSHSRQRESWKAWKERKEREQRILQDAQKAERGYEGVFERLAKYDQRYQFH